MTKQATKSAVPDGYETLSGNLPPFIVLDIGEGVLGQVFRFRTITKTETKKVKTKSGKVEEVSEDRNKHYLDMTLIDGGEFNAGTMKKPSIKAFEAGQQVTLNVSGDLYNALRRKVWAEQGLGDDFWPADGEEFPEAKWSLLYGRGIFVRREEDGKIKKGQYAGNKKNRWTVALAPRAVQREAAAA